MNGKRIFSIMSSWIATNGHSPLSENHLMWKFGNVGLKEELETILRSWLI